MDQSVETLREIALVHLQYAVLDINMLGDRASLSRAVRHSKDAEACLKQILKKMSELEGVESHNSDTTTKINL
ncbi:hypothetical protein M2323_001855 [Rhodoblastus acidophilus]|uniref:hypothetical protein n=1 Tax=Rhodoblastus acidophilus TaxID=1074 RepID=UPI0022248E43|nr:hypothetical protein [Rhodoblastus acidophilus]MCW2283713.1 hypothetical protein [Rhodoblastus acidophilus]MCW2332938.1 hypothetical protein [Rhodoblastus acidophilus]